ncbi:MAG: hypothetical protein ACJ70T_06730 [Nitrososphaera sp.]
MSSQDIPKNNSLAKKPPAVRMPKSGRLQQLTMHSKRHIERLRGEGGERMSC